MCVRVFEFGPLRRLYTVFLQISILSLVETKRLILNHFVVDVKRELCDVSRKFVKF